MGTSTLYHLARAGCTDTLLLERDTLGSGSTSKAAGGFRAQFSDELNIRIALESIERLRRFGEEPGDDIDFKQWGYLFLLREEEVPAFEEAVALQNRLGVPSRLITPREALGIVPGLGLDDVAAATFCPTDGYATPETVAQGYARAAAPMGAGIVQGCPVEEILVDGRRVRGVATPRGTVAADRVVCAAGVWSVELAGAVEVHLPVRAERRNVFLTGPGDLLPRELPLTIDFATGFYFQREGNGLLFGGPHPSLEELAPDATRRLPALTDLEIRPGWWGYYAMSPDHNAIVGAARSPDGLLYASGFSGHGFQQSPVVGEYLADLALDREPAFDLSAFALERFEADDLRPEAHVV